MIYGYSSIDEKNWMIYSRRGSEMKLFVSVLILVGKKSSLDCNYNIIYNKVMYIWLVFDVF